MANDNYHVTSGNDGGWDIKREGASRASAHFESHDAALSKAREMAGRQGVRLILHDEEGQITANEAPEPPIAANDPKPLRKRVFGRLGRLFSRSS
ncbi:DUF2188 domain-containing protein [Parvularcula sp. ZS-1/3]|uniref:DUF2188 domain-containing protein n=1 Tax=Parvularcula mediterranea TaxID=2732508 RepID=A0A7Y3W4M8_9PROT|nr:DUF2188 domain-containing protein [Parvularcula mediterranea]NNU15623.1 DUF2188 domain-containing protein [Parvularcula mediterranea]